MIPKGSETINSHLQPDDLKRLAAGRWIQILRSVCRLTESQLNPRVHGPCPKCGGSDRFRAMDDVEESGGLFCNQCFSRNNGDGLAAVRWLRNCTFPEALRLVADEIGQVSCVPGGWITSAIPEPGPLYRLPEVIDATEVWICEGEKAADAAALLGLTATTSAGGSNAAEKTDWRPMGPVRNIVSVGEIG